jgi:hypothetical protein
MLELIEVGQRKSKVRHYVDASRYTFLSRAKSLCGMSGVKLIQYNAAYFNYKLVHPKLCKKCQGVLLKQKGWAGGKD